MLCLRSAWQYVELSYEPVEAYWWQPDPEAAYVRVIYVSGVPHCPPNVYLVLCGTVPLLPPAQGESLPSLVQRSLDETGIDLCDDGEHHVRIGPWRGNRNYPQPDYYAVLHGRTQIRTWIRKHFIT